MTDSIFRYLTERVDRVCTIECVCVYSAERLSELQHRHRNQPTAGCLECAQQMS